MSRIVLPAVSPLTAFRFAQLRPLVVAICALTLILARAPLPF